MENLLLDASVRSATVKAKAIRASGRVPAVVYGVGSKPEMVDVDYQGFRKVYTKAGSNTIVQLKLNGKEHPVLVKDVTYDPVSDFYQHVDFLKIDMNKTVTAAVKVEFIGVSPAVKNLGGILDIHKHELKIKCLPKDLVHSIQVDISPIVDFHTSVHVKDVKFPAGITVLDNLEDTVVTASHIKVEVATPTAAAAATPAEGAAPAAGTPAEGAAPAAAKGGDKK